MGATPVQLPHRVSQHLPHRPRLNSGVRIHGGVSASGGDDAELHAILDRSLARMTGALTLDELANAEPGLAPSDLASLVESLDRAGLVDDVEPVRFRPGSEVILEIEDLVEERCAATIFKNPFWTTCLAASRPGDLPEKLAIGMVIENWHFLFRESYFDAPVLSYVPNTAVRLLLNEFFSEEYGHDEILLKALNFAGLGRDDMADAIPLPATMALCNALAFWAHSDPLFFFTTLGLLEGQGMKQDSFIDACERCSLPSGILGPLKAHANINLKSSHGNLTRAIFGQIPVIDEATVERMKDLVPLFVELYDDFYTAVWRYYTSDAPLLRRVSTL
jgi:hypothetical protein